MYIGDWILWVEGESSPRLTIYDIKEVTAAAKKLCIQEGKSVKGLSVSGLQLWVEGESSPRSKIYKLKEARAAAEKLCIKEGKPVKDLTTFGLQFEVNPILRTAQGPS